MRQLLGKVQGHLLKDSKRSMESLGQLLYNLNENFRIEGQILYWFRKKNMGWYPMVLLDNILQVKIGIIYWEVVADLPAKACDNFLLRSIFEQLSKLRKRIVQCNFKETLIIIFERGLKNFRKVWNNFPKKVWNKFPTKVKNNFSARCKKFKTISSRSLEQLPTKDRVNIEGLSGKTTRGCLWRRRILSFWDS